MENMEYTNQVHTNYLQGVINEVVHPRMASTEKAYNDMQRQCEEWAKLKFTCQRLLSEAPRVAEGKTALEEKVFMNIEVRDTKHVVVKIAEDILVEMPLQEAIKVCDRKADMLKNMMTKTQATLTQHKSDLTMLLGMMRMPYVEPINSKPTGTFPSRTKV